jgi:hypothetical protein
MVPYEERQKKKKKKIKRRNIQDMSIIFLRNIEGNMSDKISNGIAI